MIALAYSYDENQNFDLARQLDGIIKKRQPLVESLKKAQTNLEARKQAIQELDNLRQRLVRSPDHQDIASQLNDIDLPKLLRLIKFRLQKLETLIARFERGTINFGVVGGMGQGKSTLLQAISGLSDEIIPTRRGGGACTAVRSTIYHQPGATEVFVTFHDEDSFIREVIQPYYTELGLQNPPKNLDDFARQTLLLELEDATKKAMLARLRDEYQMYLSEYRPLLDGITQKISVEEIAKYVTHQYDENHRLESCEHLAVSRVEIYCEFPNREAIRLALVDIPGLGDLRVGDEKLMLETLGKEVDVVLFVRRPDAERDSWNQNDTRLYSTTKQALSDLSDRSFMILNRRQTENQSDDNLTTCNYLQETIQKAQLDVVHALLVDCSDVERANDMLDSILNYLADNIEELDKRQNVQLEKQLEQLKVAIAEELDKASSILSKYANDRLLFVEHRDAFILQLSKELRELRDRLKQQREEADPDFSHKVTLVLEECRQNLGIPETQQILDEYGLPESKESFLKVYIRYVVEMRAAISQSFLTLNQGLKLSLDSLKNSATTILADHLNLGRLTSLGKDQFLNEMADLLKEKDNQLELGFRTLAEAQMSYEGLILADLREHLETLLNPDKQTLDLDKTDNPEQLVKTELEKLHQQVLARCEETLQQYLSGPSRVKYFLIQEFLDRILFAKNIEKQWDFLLDDSEVRSEVWPEFKQYEERKQIQMAWKTLVQKAQKLNDPQDLRFLD